jgi:hypothetical protein
MPALDLVLKNLQTLVQNGSTKDAHEIKKIHIL